MNSSQFMDKQILGLSGSQLQQQGDELFDLMIPQEENGSKKEEIVPSYDFQPIRTVGSSLHTTSGGVAGDGPPPSWGSADSKLNSSLRKNASILETHELSKVNYGKDKSAYDDATVAEIDHTVKKYADNLLHALEGISSRLSQLESRTLHLENSVDELKTTIGSNNGSTDGKLRQLGNILGEVQTGIQVLRDKQEIWEAQLELRKLEVSKGHSQSTENANTGQLNSQQQQVSPPQQHIQQQQVSPPQQHIQQLHQLPAPTAQPNMLPALPAPEAPPPPIAQRNPPAAQYPTQLPQTQIPSVPSLPREPYYGSPAQSTESAHPQYQVAVQQPQPQPPPPPQPQHYQSSPQLPQYSQPPQIPQPINPSPQLQPPLPQHPEESAPYLPAQQTYQSNIHQPASFTQQPSGSPPNQFYGPNPSMYEPPTSRTSLGQPPISAGYGPPMGPSYSDAYPYSGSPSHRSSSAVKSSPFVSSAASAGGSSYTRLPTAQILPQAPPSGSSAGGPSGNKVPIDDVVEKVATMGFSRDQVRATVKKLTENGQSVDLNVVLDKLMNDSEIQPQKGWFGR